jgi:hypothetical protein
MTSKLSFLIFLLQFLVLNAYAAESTLCEKSEVQVANCIIEGGKSILSICTPGISQKEDYVEYRYGKKRAIELRHRADAVSGKKIFRGTFKTASNDVKLFWFSSGEYTYRFQIPGTGVSRLGVLKGDAILSEKKCPSNADENSAVESKFISEAPPEEIDRIMLLGR